MTREQIFKGLKCCQTQYDKNCAECPYGIYRMHAISVKSCSSRMLEDVLLMVESLSKGALNGLSV